jgi:hypothetical protein
LDTRLERSKLDAPFHQHSRRRRFGVGNDR